MNKKVLVSVIIPYYRKINYIKQTLDSVLKQSFKNFEVIIIYDDNDKQELKFLKKLINKSNKKKIRIILNRNNMGVGETRNKGIKNSKGKFLAFIDADDIWNKNKLKYQLEFMIKTIIILLLPPTKLLII